ncbi:putative adhesin/invasin, partial [Taylorella asinigenitalis 14/45]
KTLNLKGGATDVSNEDNIGVVKGNDNTLNVRLAKNLKGIESIDGLK